MKKIYSLFIFCLIAATTVAQTICNAGGNLMIFSNYDGGSLNIDVDVNIPNLKIGVVSYEGVTITINGAFAGNVTGVAYAGYDGSNNHCGSVIATSISGAPGTATTNISQYPPATLSNSNGYGSIICAYSCSNTTNQGGCNTVDQVEDYFLNFFPGSVIYAHKVQSACWTGNQQISGGGTCCPLTTSTTDLMLDEELSVYPNPATEEITFAIPNGFSSANLKIIGLDGKTLIEKTNLNGTSAEILVSDLANGIYFVEISNSTTISRTRFIKND